MKALGDKLEMKPKKRKLSYSNNDDSKPYNPKYNPFAPYPTASEKKIFAFTVIKNVTSLSLTNSTH